MKYSDDLKKGDVVVDRKGQIMLVCCSADCGEPMFMKGYKNHDDGGCSHSYKYIADTEVERIGTI